MISLSLLCLLSVHRKNSWGKNKWKKQQQEEDNAKVNTGHCIQFWADFSVWIHSCNLPHIWLSQKSHYLLHTSSNENHPGPWHSITKKQSMKICAMENYLYNSEIPKTRKEMCHISQDPLKIHSVLSACSALLYISSSTLTEKPLCCKKVM